MRSWKLLVVNALTCSRLVAGVLVILLVNQYYWLPGALLLLSGFATDLLDGWLARKWSVTTKLGKRLDESFDRFLLASPILAMGYSGQLPFLLASTLVVGIFAADILAENFGLMRVVWWPICYGVVIVALTFAAFAVVGVSKSDEVRKAIATIKHPKPSSDQPA